MKMEDLFIKENITVEEILEEIIKKYKVYNTATFKDVLSFNFVNDICVYEYSVIIMLGNNSNKLTLKVGEHELVNSEFFNKDQLFSLLYFYLNNYLEKLSYSEDCSIEAILF